MLAKEQPYVRSIDIATELGFSKPSVSVAMKNLRENGYILMDDQGHITLSSMGKEIAETMYERHTMLSQWLMYLGVDEQTAAEDACRIEHVVSAEASGPSRTILPRGMSFRKTFYKARSQKYSCCCP